MPLPRPSRPDRGPATVLPGLPCLAQAARPEPCSALVQGPHKTPAASLAAPKRYSRPGGQFSSAGSFLTLLRLTSAAETEGVVMRPFTSFTRAARHVA